MDIIELTDLRLEIATIKAVLTDDQQKDYNSTIKNIMNQLPDSESGFRKSLLRAF